MSTYNSTTKTLSVDNIIVSNQLTVKGELFDSDTVDALISAAKSISSSKDVLQDQIDVALQASLDSERAVISAIDTRLAATEVKAGNHDSDIPVLKTSVITINSRLRDDSDRIASLQNQASNHDSDLLAVNTLPQKVESAEINVAKLDSDVLAVSGKVDTIQTTSVSHGTRITTVEGQTSSIDTRLTAAEFDIDNIQTAVGAANLTTSAQALTTAVNELDAEVGDLSSLTNAAGNLVLAVNGVVAALSAETIRLNTLRGEVDDLIARVGTGATAFALDDLADVNLGAISGADTGKVLEYNGTNWVPGTDD